jgi:hypothetical protein
MNNCKKCNKEFEPKKGLINYCSMECRNSREWSDEDKFKKSESAKKSEKVKLTSERNRLLIDFKKIGELNRETANRKILDENFENLSFERLKKRVSLEQNGNCNRCGISDWLGEKITLELEHKDGNHFNNQRDNLECLCPNCHSLTPTWRGRNKGDKREKVSDELLLKTLLDNNWNMRQSLIQVGLSPKGANYPKCHRLKKWYEENTRL